MDGHDMACSILGLLLSVCLSMLVSFLTNNNVCRLKQLYKSAAFLRACTDLRAKSIHFHGWLGRSLMHTAKTFAWIKYQRGPGPASVSASVSSQAMRNLMDVRRLTRAHTDDDNDNDDGDDDGVVHEKFVYKPFQND